MSEGITGAVWPLLLGIGGGVRRAWRDDIGANSAAPALSHNHWPFASPSLLELDRHGR
jgi:hypothetical protein